jgi:hypothetical protein
MSLRLLALLALAPTLGAADAKPASPPATLLAQPVAPLVVDALTAGSEMGRWLSTKGKWERRPDGLRGEEVEADKHNAVNRLGQPLGDFVFACEFRFDGAKGFSFSVNDPKEHLTRVLLTPTSFTARKDDRDKKGPDVAITYLTEAVKLDPGTWHSLVVEMVGDTFVATLDGKVTAVGTHELFRGPKVSPGFTVDGAAATFRNVAVWSARPEPKPDWKARRDALAGATSAK